MRRHGVSGQRYRERVTIRSEESKRGSYSREDFGEGQSTKLRMDGGGGGETRTYVDVRDIFLRGAVLPDACRILEPVRHMHPSVQVLSSLCGVKIAGMGNESAISKRVIIKSNLQTPLSEFAKKSPELLSQARFTTSVFDSAFGALSNGFCAQTLRFKA